MSENDFVVPDKLSPEQMKALFGNRFETETPSDIPSDNDASRPISDIPLAPAELPSDLSPEATNVVGINVETNQVIVKPRKASEPFIKMPPITNTESSIKPSSIDDMLRQIAKTSDFQPYDLPSRGLLDADNAKLSCGQLLIRPMRAGEEEILTTGRLFRSGEAVEMIFKRCTMFTDRSPLTDPLQLLSLDRMALLIAIRILSYGSIYDFAVNCGNCRRSFESHVDLDEDLDVHLLDPDLGLNEPMHSIFPESGIDFTYRLSRGVDEEESIRYSRERERKYGGKAIDDSFIERAKRLVISVGGFDDKEAIGKAINLLKGRDLHHLRSAIDNQPFGVDTRITLECPFCMAENRMRLPMGADFFIPPLRTTQESSQE